MARTGCDIGAPGADLEEMARLAAAKLIEIAVEMSASAEFSALQHELVTLAATDAALADQLLERITAFTSAHAKTVAVSFYRWGVADGDAPTKQQQAHRNVRPKPSGSRRLQ